jgi:hypothetical protein
MAGRMTLELSPPYNWCDRRCERCPLAGDCPIPAMEDRPMLAWLEEAVALLAAEGVDPDERPPPPPDDREVILAAVMDWAVRAHALRRHFAEIERLGVFVVGKVARVSRDEDGDDEYDTVPNLLALEHALAAVAAGVDRLRATGPPAALARFDEQDRILRGLLAPLLGRIRAHHRRFLAALVAAGRAPSPFGYHEPCTPSTTGRRSRDAAS